MEQKKLNLTLALMEYYIDYAKRGGEKDNILPESEQGEDVIMAGKLLNIIHPSINVDILNTKDADIAKSIAELNKKMPF